MASKQLDLLDVNPLEHITGDVAISQYNYESVMNGLVQWDQSRADKVTIRIATRTEPYFVDYTIPTKYFYDKNYGVINTAVLLDPSNFAYKNRMKMTAAKDDDVTLRINSVDTGDVPWKLYEDVTVYDEVKYDPYVDDGIVIENTYVVHRQAKFTRSYATGLYFRTYDENTHRFVIYKTLVDIEANDDLPTLEVDGRLVDTSTTPPTDLAIRVCMEGDSITPTPLAIATSMYYSTATMYNMVFIRILNSQVSMSSRFTAPNSGYEKYCAYYDMDKAASYTEGTLVYYEGDFFVCLVDHPTTTPVYIAPTVDGDTCGFHPNEWARVLPMPFTRATIEGSGTIRYKATTDVNGYIFRNVGNRASGDHTSISVTGNIAIAGNSTPQPTGLNVLQTSNYANWPEHMSSKWLDGSSYRTIDSISAFGKQDYSAVMVFKHFGDEEHFRYKNIINYDGPDLDQGLCIMLPVKITDTQNVMHEPMDGMVIEFMFNIWPNHKYDGRDVNDLIINKSQIYVYSVPDYTEYLINGFTVRTVEPIAKFSMARLTNFYIFAENVGVPDRPVCYKARFIYSKKEQRWKTYDYYQLPDHIFLSPNGFVDPSQPEAYGVQTGGFPLYQNPFSSYDLSAIHVDENYRNQLQRPGEDPEA